MCAFQFCRQESLQKTNVKKFISLLYAFSVSRHSMLSIKGKHRLVHALSYFKTSVTLQRGTRRVFCMYLKCDPH